MDKLDAIDLKLLNIIQHDSRKTIKEMAEMLHITSTPVFERLKRLEKDGFIDRYVAILNHSKLGKKMQAFIHLSIIDHSKEAVDSFVSQIEDYPEVMECHHVTGDSDFLIKVVVRDIEEFNDFITEKLSTVSNIGRLKSSFSLSVRKQTTAYDIFPQ